MLQAHIICVTIFMEPSQNQQPVKLISQKDWRKQAYVLIKGNKQTKSPEIAHVNNQNKEQN